MNVLYANDNKGQHPESYYHASAQPMPLFPALQQDKRCQVCVIGGGYTGLSSALHLAEAGYDVIVLDAHRIGWGASGRNGGQLSSALRLEQPELEQMVGANKAKRLWQLGRTANLSVRELIKKHNINCDLKDGVVHANHKARYSNHSKSEVAHLQDVYSYEKISYLDNAAITALLGTKAYHSGTLDLGAAHLHPLKLAFGLARAAQKAGVRFFEQSEVMNIEHCEPAVVSTKKSKITADFVIIACNGYLGSLEKSVAAKVMPINNFIIATEPLSVSRARQLISQNYAVADSKFVINYYRLSRDNRLLFGGGENYSYKFPADIKSFVRKPMLEIYPQLDDVKIDYGWGGTLGITMSRMPVFARLSTNVFSAGGYSGEGLGMGTFAGVVLAELISGSNEKFDLLASIPARKFPGGMAARAPLLALAMLYYSLRDRF